MLNLADFALQEQLEGNLMVAISQVWYNGSYTIAAKPIKSLELHYTMIQFLINIYISMKVSVQLPGNSANTVCLTSEKGKVARQQQVVRQTGVRGNLQLLCN